MVISEKIEFLSIEIGKLNKLIEDLAQYEDDIGNGKKSNKLILEDAVFKKGILQQLLNELQ
jgi:hypothetical protein